VVGSEAVKVAAAEGLAGVAEGAEREAEADWAEAKGGGCRARESKRRVSASTQVRCSLADTRSTSAGACRSCAAAET